jgi:hypothetical protein
MFRNTQDPSSGSIDSYLVETTRSGSTVLIVCAVGVWRHIQDLMIDPAWSETRWSNFNVWFILEFYITQIVISTTSIFECISRLIKSQYSLMMDPEWSETRWSNFNVGFILEFYITQILISTTSKFEYISRLIKVTDNNDARWKLEIEIGLYHLMEWNQERELLDVAVCMLYKVLISLETLDELTINLFLPFPSPVWTLVHRECKFSNVCQCLHAP